MLLAFAWFAANYLILATLLRLASVKAPNNPVVRAFTFAH